MPKAKAVKADATPEVLTAESPEVVKRKLALRKLVQKHGEPIPTEWMKTGLPWLDLLCGNGIPVGHIIEASGKELAGKSLMAWTLAKVFQDKGWPVLLYEVEATEPLEFMRKLGVDPDLILRPDEPLETVEQIRDDLIAQVAGIRKTDGFKDCPILVIWDSIAATTCLEMWEKKDIKAHVPKEYAVGALARAMSGFLAQHTTYIKRERIVLFCVNQLREKIGVMFGNPETTPGGRALKHYAALRLRLNRGKKITKEGDVLGSECHVSTEKNKFAPSFRKADTRIMNNKGFDPLTGLEALLVQSGRISKTEIEVEGADGKKKRKEVYKVGENAEDLSLPALLEKYPDLLGAWL